jgi:hypothetical protein
MIGTTRGGKVSPVHWVDVHRSETAYVLILMYTAIILSQTSPLTRFIAVLTQMAALSIHEASGSRSPRRSEPVRGGYCTVTQKLQVCSAQCSYTVMTETKYNICRYTNQSLTITVSSKMLVFLIILCMMQNGQAFRFHPGKTVEGLALKNAKGSVTHVLFAATIFSSSVSPIPLSWSIAVRHASIFSLQFCNMRAYPV